MILHKDKGKKNLFTMPSTWNIGEMIVDKNVNYDVSIYWLDGIPVRCLTTSDDIPIAVIIYVLGHGDWIFFNPSTFDYMSMIPRILNKWHMHQESTYEETKRVQEILSNAYAQAAEIMDRIVY